MDSGEDMVSGLQVSTCRRTTRRPVSTHRAHGQPTLHRDQYNVHYLTAYLGTVTGNLGQRGMVIHSVELTSGPQSLGCSITFDPPRQAVSRNTSAWVTYRASWNEHRGWCCHLRHVAVNYFVVRRYLGEPLVAAPEVVANFIAGLSRVQSLGTLGRNPPAACGQHTPQEFADDLVRFIPTCVWIG